MKRPIFVLLTVLLLSLPLAAADQSSAQPARVDELLEKALAAQQRGDYNGALQLLNQAVEADPKSTAARMRRMVLLESVQGAGGNEESNRWLSETLREDLRALSQLAPDSREGGIARDALAKLEGRVLFPDPEVSCSKEAASEMGQAERLLSARKGRESLAHYKKAVELCPDHPIFWIHYADAHYALGEMAEARALFEKGLAKAPWYAPGHRFLADTLARSRDWEGGYHEAVLAVLSNPTYEAGWQTLKDFIVGRDGVWLRVYGEKPQVKIESEGSKINLNLPSSLSDSRPDGPAWMLYGLLKAASHLPEQPAEKKEKPAAEEAKPAPPAPKTPLERERVAVLGVLESHRSQQGKDAVSSPFWDMMDRAERAGFLDEAIYLHLLDEELLPGYREHREKSRERLVRYVETVLAPLPPRKP